MGKLKHTENEEIVQALATSKRQIRDLNTGTCPRAALLTITSADSHSHGYSIPVLCTFSPQHPAQCLKYIQHPTFVDSYTHSTEDTDSRNS